MAIANSDGSIVLSTKINTDGISKGLAAMKGKNAFSVLAREAKTYQLRLKELEKEYAQLSALQIQFPDDERLQPAIERTKSGIEATKRLLNELNNALSATGKKSTKSFDSMSSGLKQFGKRLAGIIKSALVFSVVYRVMQSVVKLFKNILMSDEEFKQDWEELKAAIYTAAYPIVELIVPALKWIVYRVKEWAVSIGNVAASLQGMSYAELVDQAKASKEAADNYEKMASDSGKIAKNAKKQLASFDEIEVLSEEKGEDDYSAFEGLVADGFGLSSSQFDFSSIIKKILADVPKLIEAVVKSLPSIVEPLLMAAPQIISSFMAASVASTPIIIGASHDIVFGIIEALPQIIQGLIAELPTIISLVYQSILSTGPRLIYTVGKLILSLVKALPSVMASLVAAIPAALSGVWDAVVNFWKDYIEPIFTAEWWKNIGKTCINGLIEGFEGGINGIIWAFESMINWIVEGFNKISFSVPDWVPAVGGKTFGINIPKASFGRVSIPRLATGSVIPPNREFLAVLGDNKKEHEIVSPVSTMKQAFIEAMLETGGNFGNGGNTTVVLEIDGREFGRAVVEQGNRENRRVGTRLVIA